MYVPLAIGCDCHMQAFWAHLLRRSCEMRRSWLLSRVPKWWDNDTLLVVLQPASGMWISALRDA